MPLSCGAPSFGYVELLRPFFESPRVIHAVNLAYRPTHPCRHLDTFLAQITQDVTFHDRTPFLTVDGAMTKDDYVTNYGVLQEAFDTRLVPEEVQLHSAGSFLELHKAILDFYSRYPTMGRQSNTNTDPHALAKQEQAKKMHVAIEDRVQCEQRQQLRDVRSVLKGLHTYCEFLPWHKQTLPKLSATFTVASGSTTA